MTHHEAVIRLVRHLPRLSSPEVAAAEVVAALASFGLGGAVAAVEGDTAVLLAIQTVPGGRLAPELAERMLGMRLPIEGVRAHREAVRMLRPYWGRPGAVETLRSLARGSDLAVALPAAAEEHPVLAVPVLHRERAVALITAWGETCGPALAPALEAMAAILGAVWSGALAEGERFRPVPVATAPARHHTLNRLLASGRIVAALQPILRLLDETVIGYEALARFPPEITLEAPDDLFAWATALNMQAAVDLACMEAAFRAAPQVGGGDLFVNVLIGTLLDARGMSTLDRSVAGAHVDPASVVLEFSEREPVPDLTRLQGIAAELRARGYRIAVDDAGAGHASMRMVAEVRPEFIKVDRSLIHSLDTDRARRALVVALLSFSGHIGARLVAEGVETAAERDALLSLGVQFGQGWALGRPVLTRAVEGHPDLEVVDPGWFSRRRVVPAAPRPPSPAPAAAESPPPPPRERRRGLARALTEATQALQSEHDAMRILRVIADQLIGVVPVRDMAMYAADYETHRLIPVLARGTDTEAILSDSFPLDAGITGWALTQGVPQNIPDSSAHPLARQVPGTPVVQESLLLVPLLAADRKLGIIACWREGVGRFTGRELEAASLFAHVAASAWRNAQLYTELLDAAMTDPLTHLYNSRWLRDTAQRDLLRWSRDGRSLALLLLDLDHFKVVNDSAGHAAGDLLLQRVAVRLRAAVRSTDAVVRLGGEEFVVLLYDASAEEAEQVAESIRLALHEVPVPPGCRLAGLTASIGVAAHPEHGTDLDQLLAAADRAMYTAKGEGRDRVAVAARAGGEAKVVPIRRGLRRLPPSRPPRERLVTRSPA